MRVLSAILAFTSFAATAASAALEWKFPTGDASPHEGMAFADGETGVLAWGGGDTLKLTFGRADLWDHRGGYEWTAEQSYSNIVDAIRKGEKGRLLGLFKKTVPPGEPRNPTMLPLGRVDVKIPGATLKRGTLDVKTGLGTVEFDVGGETLAAELAMSKESRQFSMKFPDGVAFEAKAVHCMDFPPVCKQLEAVSFKRARSTPSGFVWELPADPSVALAFAKNGAELSVCTWRGDAAPAAEPAPFDKVRGESSAHWRKFWNKSARVSIPDREIQEMFDYGMYRFGAMTDPDGVPAGLQGPWIEEDAIPPWSGDYHFNINVQMCYSPAYRGGHFAHLKPLFKMILSWMPTLRDNARKFAGVDGCVLPHSVDDRGVNIGGFWTGTIDHGSTAWVADMMWRYVKYSGDVAFLREGAYDYMKGAMKVYRAMMEETPDGRLAFPAGPSPEWGASDFHKAIGRNPSFQLAAAHRLARDLASAAALLGEEPDPMWQDVEKRLPLAAIDDANGGIQIFDGVPLSESHRHHSHLAGFYPFDIFDPFDPATAATAEKTFERWRDTGPGRWVGWTMPWTSVLETHAGRADLAADALGKWLKYFTDPGRGSHVYPWRNGFRDRATVKTGKDGRPLGRQLMQMDGHCAFVAAVLEMMVHETNGKTEFFKGCPDEWDDVSFENVALSDGRRASGRRKGGKAEVTVDAAARAEAPCGRFSHEMPEATNEPPLETPYDELASTFADPSGRVQTGCYWYWMNGFVSRDGIRRDLEAMKRAGIDRAYIGDICAGNERGPVKTFSKEWHDALQTAFAEAARLGIEIGLFNSPGWSQSGEPLDAAAGKSPAWTNIPCCDAGIPPAKSGLVGPVALQVLESEGKESK